MDPDFGFKANVNLANRKRSNCKLNTEADSEIPELGLDSGRLNIDCDINPVRVANAAFSLASQYRHNHPHQPYRADSRKRTRINIDSEYERVRDNQDPLPAPVDESSEVDDQSGATNENDDEDDDD